MFLALQRASVSPLWNNPERLNSTGGSEGWGGLGERTLRGPVCGVRPRLETPASLGLGPWLGHVLPSQRSPGEQEGAPPPPPTGWSRGRGRCLVGSALPGPAQPGSARLARPKPPDSGGAMAGLSGGQSQLSEPQDPCPHPPCLGSKPHWPVPGSAQARDPGWAKGALGFSRLDPRAPPPPRPAQMPDACRTPAPPSSRGHLLDHLPWPLP